MDARALACPAMDLFAEIADEVDATGRGLVRWPAPSISGNEGSAGPLVAMSKPLSDSIVNRARCLGCADKFEERCFGTETTAAD